MQLRVGTRGSRLALEQTKLVVQALQALDPLLQVETHIISTKGDQILHLSLDKIGGKGLFVSEIEDQLRRGAIDFAVHSMKDMPTDITEFELIPCLKRADPRDVLITPFPIDNVGQLKDHARIGSGSKRRLVELQALVPTVEVVPIRGNVETRIQKMHDQGLDGIVLAAAGLSRLNLNSCQDYHLLPLPVEDMVPAPAQGMIACQILKGNTEVKKRLLALVHKPSSRAVNIERAFLSAIQGSCHLPIGAFYEEYENLAKFWYLYGNDQGTYVEKGCQHIDLSTFEIANTISSTMEDMAARLGKQIEQRIRLRP